MARLLYRLGRFSARHRLAFTVGWLLSVVGLGAVAVSGMQVSAAGFDIPSLESSKALTIVEEKFGGPSDAPETSEAQLVVVSPEDITTGSGPATVERLVSEAGRLPYVASVADPFDPEALRVSPDKSAAVIDVTFADLPEQEVEASTASLDSLAESARAEGLVAEVGGALGEDSGSTLGPSEIIGAAIAFFVLLITFGSLVAAGANMLTAVVGVGAGVLGIMASSVISPIGSSTPVLAVMLGLAVGIDYGLFVLARFRSELREGRSIDEAVGRAVGTAGSSVVFAGSTVIIALVGLSVVGIPFVSEMGIAAAFAVAVAVLISLTLLPGIMRTMGYRALPKKERGLDQVARSAALVTVTKPGVLETWVRTVVRRPVVCLVSAVGLLGVLAIPVLSLQTALTVPGGEDPDSTQRAAYEIVNEKFGEGSQSPLIVLVEADGDNLQAVLPQVEATVGALEGVVMVTPAQTSQDGTAALLTVIPSTDAVSPETGELVQAIRDANNQVDGAQMLVTGTVALDLDINAKLASALGIYLLVIVGLAMALLILLFRSILVPVVATVGFLLSFGAGLGVMIAVFQWGWLDALISAPQGNPVLSLLPLLVVGILFGLAMDYQVFLVSRMHEAHSRGLSPVSAIVDGFKRSAVVVVAAATIMATVFGGFALSPSSLVGSIALALTVGVVADAFVVRMILVPAMLTLLGEKAWWIPAWLDKVLPNIDAEGKALDHLAPEHEPERDVTPARA